MGGCDGVVFDFEGFDGKDVFVEPSRDKLRRRLVAYVQWEAEEFARCVDQCLAASELATRGHCEAKCRSDN